jgi:hypothetical protein
MVLELIIEAMRAQDGGDPIVVRYLRSSLIRKGENPAELLEECSSRFVVFDRPLRDSGSARATPFGLWSYDEAAPEIHDGFVPALRRCWDLYLNGGGSNPTQVRPVLVTAGEILPGTSLTPPQLRIVGELFDVAGIGSIQRTCNSPSTLWTMEVLPKVLDYRRVGIFSDYLEIWLDEPT